MAQQRRGRGRTSDVEVEKVALTRESFRHTLEIFRYLKPYRLYFFLGLISLALSTGTTFGFFYFLKDLIDPAVAQESGWENRLQQIALYLGLILVVQALFSFLRIYFFARVSERTLADIRLAVYHKLISLGIPFFEERRVGELTSRITADVGQLQDTLSGTLAEFIRQVLTFVIGLTVLLTVSVKLSLVMLATIPVTIILAMVIGRRIRGLSRAAQDALAEANVVVEETLQNVRTVKAFANEWFEIGRFRRQLREVVRHGLRAANARGLFVVFLITAVFGGITVVIWFGATLIGAGELTVGTLVYFIMITLFIGGSIAGLGDLYGQIQKAVGASERLRDILRKDSELEPGDAAPVPAERLNGEIVFQHVRFAYPTRPDIEVLHDIDLHIAPGQKVALVGQSGAGKSTITQLILRYYDVGNGQLRVDGQDIRDLDRLALRAQVGIVPQEVMLFGGTIRENIAYGRPGASDVEIRQAAEQANAWEFIARFPEGLHTLVGDRGVQLSGGQRQRIAIARAILKDPAILILDEATSSLDAESEHLVQEALNHLMEGRTTLIIAHRLSTIREVDQIYVLEGGRICESGTHAELSEQEGPYRNLLRLQFQV
ncbi:MAG: ATP-binding cassette domain-containing protein [Bacteroidetes bacterium]|nr:MAG: ATP-binding cassette domain-containing protein [Bacteroidota bacterium]